ncbi:MAG TPA: DinB family protein [Ignavibacteriaceae bacterium]|nr:DinB family protein [Ignavibacteriaceae bacterium]
MLKQIKWIERKFDFNFPSEIFSSVLERFRGTPARLEELVKGLSGELLIKKINNKWSIQEHAGHLFDLEELGERRIDDFLKRAKILTPADINNRKTNEANYDSKDINDILLKFRKARESTVSRLEKLNERELQITSIHPRLNQKMRIVDWVYFMCEHDDHHLTSIRIISASN